MEGGTVVFDVPEDFLVNAVVGQGAYGAVCKAEWDGVDVAIKKVPHYAKSLDTTKKVLREVEILQFFQFCQQVVACHKCFRPRSGEKDMYMVMDYVASDLSTMMKKGVQMNEDIVRFIACQLLLALRAVHFYSVIHRDLSCRNILINENSQIQVCDFGLARFYDPEEALSFGVVTQWYRAPEIIADAKYDTKSDVFSVGVVLGELLARKHLFPGKPNDPADQLHRVFSILGTPNRELYADASQPYFSASENAKRYIEMYIDKKPTKNRVRQLKFEVPHSPDALDVVEALLSFDPRARPTADEALQMKWFDSLREFIDQECAAQDQQFKACPKFEPTNIPNQFSLEEAVRMLEKMVPVYDRSITDEWKAANAAAREEEEEADEEAQ